MMFKVGNYEKSFELYRKIDLESALKASYFLKPEDSIGIAAELGILGEGFYRNLVKLLLDQRRFEDAGLVKRDHLGENAMTCFLDAKKPLEALSELMRHMKSIGRGFPLLEGSNSDPLLEEFLDRITRMEEEEDTKFDKKVLQIEKYMKRWETLNERDIDLSETTFSYSVSGINVKMGEEEFVQRRLRTLYEEVQKMQVRELIQACEQIGLGSRLRDKYGKVESEFESFPFPN